MAYVEQYWAWALLALLVAVIVIWVLRARAPRQDAPAAPAEPKAPLQPVKPDIVAAEPARFAAAEPDPVVAPPPVVDAVPVITPAAGAPDNLALIKGVGPKLVTLLGGLGVTRFDQIAGWSDTDLAAIDARLGAFAGRAARDNWIDQAGYLARGDKAGFEAKYGALGGEI
jgi:predicted flap endonuclease-1-like 5' DNA nuclease